MSTLNNSLENIEGAEWFYLHKNEASIFVIFVNIYLSFISCTTFPYRSLC